MDVKVSKINGRFDVSIQNGDLQTIDGFDTAIFLSLMTDARASQSQVSRPEFRRGWIGDIASTIKNRSLGSLLWLTDQRRLTQKTLNEVIDYANKSMQWFVTDGIAREVEVTGNIVPRRGIALTIKITAPDGTTRTHYVPLWEVTGVS